MTATSWACRQQQGSNGYDDALTMRARAQHARRSHWWGRRTVNNVHGAWCYLCQAHIATWSGRWRMTEAAKAQVELHRLHHIQGHLDLPAPDPGDER